MFKIAKNEILDSSLEKTRKVKLEMKKTKRNKYLVSSNITEQKSHDLFENSSTTNELINSSNLNIEQLVGKEEIKFDESNISKSYNEIKSNISSNEIYLFLSEEFDRFYSSVKNKKIEDKCISFQLFRMKCHEILYRKYFNLNQNNKAHYIKNALFDYIDCSISMMFFNNKLEFLSLNKRIDNDFYYALLTFAIDRIEFPSLVKEEIKASMEINNRQNIHLKRRNFLSNLMVGSRNYVIQIIEQTANQYKRIPTLIETEILCKKHKMQFFNFVCNRTSQIEKMMNKHKNNDKTFIVYRGYDIDENEDVLINRKIRLQDANKSYSFTANNNVAKMFANYKNLTIDIGGTTYDDRVNLVSSFIDSKKIESYKTKSNRKFVVAKYEIDEKDIIFMPFQTSTIECEIFANPDNAKLIRYEIIYSS